MLEKFVVIEAAQFLGYEGTNAKFRHGQPDAPLGFETPSWLTLPDPATLPENLREAGAKYLSDKIGEGYFPFMGWLRVPRFIEAGEWIVKGRLPNAFFKDDQEEKLYLLSDVRFRAILETGFYEDDED